MSGRFGRRTVALVVAGTVAIGAAVVAANADSSVDTALANRKQIGSKIVNLHKERQDRRIKIHREIRKIRNQMHNIIRIGMADERERAKQVRGDQIKRLGKLRVKERQMIRRLRAKVVGLRAEREGITQWLETLPLQRCPVDGPHDVIDGFGDVRDMPGTPYHLHQGNDIMAATGTPIVAPFDGNAIANPSDLGGQAVEVYGDAGYVYNAHLSAYGKLGAVQTGDVIGYVGSTGNATAPHDHFEWHPGNGDAIDPYDVLMSVC